MRWGRTWPSNFLNIMPYRLDSRGGTFWISNLVVGVAITCYILQMYVSNRYRVRVLWRWLVSVGLCCLASVSLVAKVQGAAMWNLVFEPLTTFTKAAYFWLWLFLRQGI